MMKAYKSAIIIGRFEPLHNGHIDIIETAFKVADKVIIFIGSAQEENTAINPFSYELRKELILNVFPQALIYPLNDVGLGNIKEWGEYVIDEYLQYYSSLPELFISGKEERRSTWFEGDRGQYLDELLINKKINISAKEVRQYLIEDNKQYFKNSTPSKNWSYYQILREIILQAKDNKNTISI